MKIISFVHKSEINAVPILWLLVCSKFNMSNPSNVLVQSAYLATVNPEDNLSIKSPIQTLNIFNLTWKCSNKLMKSISSIYFELRPPARRPASSWIWGTQANLKIRSFYFGAQGSTNWIRRILLDRCSEGSLGGSTYKMDPVHNLFY